MTLAILEAITKELQTKHHCHTVILYGSRALGLESESSDFDILGVRESGAAERDARMFNAEYLDAWIHSEAELDPLPADLIRLRHGRVLAQKNDCGTRLIARAAELFTKGPKPLAAWETELIRSWTVKTISRVARGGPEDIEANYRRASLLTQLLEDFFKLRGKWFLGPKESFEWLRKNDPMSYALFERALAPDAGRGALRALAERVLEPVAQAGRRQ